MPDPLEQEGRFSGTHLAERIEKALYESTNVWKGWELVVGPLVNLLGMVVCILILWLFRGDINDLNCRFAVAYSPMNGVFAIWSIIFTWSILSIVLQFLNPYFELHVAELSTNCLVGGAWLCSGLWTIFFTRLSRSNFELGFGLAALSLLVGSACGVAAELAEDGFGSNSTLAQVLVVSTPNSIFGGWLVVACAVSVGIFVNVLVQPESRLVCRRQSSRSEEGEEGEEGDVAKLEWIPKPRSCIEASLPLLLTLCVSALAVWRGDFVLVLPLVAALLFMRASEWRTASLVCGGIGWVATMAVFVVRKV